MMNETLADKRKKPFSLNESNSEPSSSRKSTPKVTILRSSKRNKLIDLALKSPESTANILQTPSRRLPRATSTPLQTSSTTKSQPSVTTTRSSTRRKLNESLCKTLPENRLQISLQKLSPPKAPPTKPKKIQCIPIRIGTKLYKVSKNLLKQIIRLQGSTDWLIPQVTFERLCKEIVQNNFSNNYRFAKIAIAGLHEAAEMYIADFFEDTDKAAKHAKRITIKPKDCQFVQELRKSYCPIARQLR